MPLPFWVNLQSSGSGLPLVLWHPALESHTNAGESDTHLFQVTFPLMLDCYDLCTPEYQAQLRGPREAENSIEEHKAGIAKRQKLEANAKACPLRAFNP